MPHKRPYKPVLSVQITTASSACDPRFAEGEALPMERDRNRETLHCNTNDGNRAAQPNEIREAAAELT